MKRIAAIITIFSAVFFANAQELQTSDTLSLTPGAVARVLSNAELTEAVFRIDNDMRKAGTLIVAGSLTSLCGTTFVLASSLAAARYHTGLATATSVIGALAGVAGIVLTIVGADKLRNVRLMGNGVSIMLK